MRFPVAAFLVCLSAFPLHAASIGYPAFAFLPKAERAAANARFSRMAALADSIRSEYSTSLSSLEKAETLSLLEKRLLVYHTSSPEEMLLQESLSGLPSASVEGHCAALGRQRSLRYTAALSLAGPPSALRKKSRTALETEGRLLSKQLAPRLLKATAPQLEALASELELRLSSHPDCPSRAFSDLKAAVRDLPSANLRAWIEALYALDPASLAAWSFDTAPESIGRTASTASFFTAQVHFAQAVKAKASLSSLPAAAAAAAWYLDREDVKAGLAHPLLSPPTSEALTSLSRALKAVPQVDSSLFSELAFEPWLGGAVSELSVFMDLVRTGFASRLTDDLGLSKADIETAEGVFYRLGVASVAEGWQSAEDGPVLDHGALVRAERAAQALAAIEGDGPLLEAFFPLRSDQGAFEVLHRLSRYAKLRTRITAALESALSRAESRAIYLVSGDNLSARAGRLLSSPEASTDGGLAVTIIRDRETLDPFLPILVSARIELTRSDDVIFPVAVPPSLYAAAVFRELPPTAPVLCVVHGLNPRSLSALSAWECALLASGKGWVGTSAAHAIPASLVKAAGNHLGIPPFSVQFCTAERAITILLATGEHHIGAAQGEPR